jgi:hypothetical protein
LIAFKKLTIINPEHADGLKKYAQVLEDPKCRNQSIENAI